MLICVNNFCLVLSLYSIHYIFVYCSRYFTVANVRIVLDCGISLALTSFVLCLLCWSLSTLR